MKKNIWLLILIFISASAIAQTKNENLNAHLGEMKKFFLAKDYENFANYTYPKVIEMMGGKSNMVKATEQSMTTIENDGFSFIDVNFKNPSKFLKKGDELQCSLTQVLTMDTPEGRIESEYTLIALSKNDGEKWTFIDASGKDKATMLKYFPNLHDELVIKPRIQRLIENAVETNAPKEEEEGNLDSFSDDSENKGNATFDEGTAVVSENETNTDSFAYKLGSFIGRMAAFLTLPLLLGFVILIIYFLKKRKKNTLSTKKKKAIATGQNKEERVKDHERLKTEAEQLETLKKQKEKEDPRRFMPK